jgi:hypothetical protein
MKNIEFQARGGYLCKINYVLNSGGRIGRAIYFPHDEALKDGVYRPVISEEYGNLLVRRGGKGWRFNGYFFEYKNGTWLKRDEAMCYGGLYRALVGGGLSRSQLLRFELGIPIYFYLREV